MDAIESLFVLVFVALAAVRVIAQREVSAIMGKQRWVRISRDIRVTLNTGELGVH